MKDAHLFRCFKEYEEFLSAGSDSPPLKKRKLELDEKKPIIVSDKCTFNHSETKKPVNSKYGLSIHVNDCKYRVCTFDHMLSKAERETIFNTITSLNPKLEPLKVDGLCTNCNNRNVPVNVKVTFGLPGNETRFEM